MTLGIHLIFVGLGNLSLTEQMNLVQSLDKVLPATKDATNPMAHVELFYHNVNRSLIDARASKSFKGLTKSKKCREDTSGRASIIQALNRGDVAHGFVKMTSEAPRAQRVVWERK